MSASELLRQAHEPVVAERILNERVKTKPLLARPTSPPVPDIDARGRRQSARKDQKERKRRKPKPLNARQKRSRCLYQIPEEQQKWDIFVPLRDMWRDYIREILGIGPVAGDGSKGSERRSVTPSGAGPLLAAADFHGAEIQVVRSRCVDRVGMHGIVVKDTKFTFDIVTTDNKLKTIPKEHTIFSLEVPLAADSAAGVTGEGTSPRSNLIFEFHGSQMLKRAPERAKRSFKQHFDPDL